MLLLRFIAYCASHIALLVVVSALLICAFYDFIVDGLPSGTSLLFHEPSVMTRVHAVDGSLVAEFYKERRVFLPIQAVPDVVKHAFLSAEDKSFYSHNGIHVPSIVRAIYNHLESLVLGQDRRTQGASTITQQVARIFFLSSERSFVRKMREWVLAGRLERALTKDRILELYLNKIFLGLGSYGIATASLQYFDKPVQELSISEAAYLASLPKAPNNYHPIKHYGRALERRNLIIHLMAVNGYISHEEAMLAKEEGIVVSFSQPNTPPHMHISLYFVEEVRRQLVSMYGGNSLYEGGLSVRTTLDPRVQRITRKALMNGMIAYDMKQGYRGPISAISLRNDWGLQLAKIEHLSDIPEWQVAVVLRVTDREVLIGLQPEKLMYGAISTERVKGVIPLEYFKWALKRSIEEAEAEAEAEEESLLDVFSVLRSGDVIFVEKVANEVVDKEMSFDIYRLRQVPEISGATIVLDPRTGRVLAVSGGFSFAKSEFNRATQAWRQPGSAVKPFIYAAALDSGHTPSSVIFDGPIEIETPNGQIWRPKNYSNTYFYRASILRTGLELSRNAMTVRLAQEMGIDLIAEYAKKFGIYDDITQHLSASLGAKETTLMRMTVAYATLANGGKRFKPSLIDRIQDRYGNIIYRHDQRKCLSCNKIDLSDPSEPRIEKEIEQVLDPMTAYQITSMMEGVVKNGTGRALRTLGRPVAGKTGSTNDEKDAWFIGFTPDLVVGTYIGFDHPRSMGLGQSGGRLAAPVVRDVLREALKGNPPIPFRIPARMRLFLINRYTGKRAKQGDRSAVLEAFKPGTSPPIRTRVIGNRR